jgi:probable addiction module antidote protein
MTDRQLDDAAVAEHLSEVLAENDSRTLVAVLSKTLSARDQNNVAKTAGLSRKALDKALLPTSKPSFETVSKVFKGLGLKLAAQVTPKVT